ncbi:hypothetical protein Pst134EA_002953 [Puccinia striiformis f. sp. tritici]|uniref:hypothetical protein n=1 Tax=Puccinia striiformis f. sp. tritici TaxID=168172 RepID=UPI002008D4FD|nr:hypothetical protein Pst134EA_002953 [Puccinia striiformis f. sp. tritici]KAH9472331.1 hypothetical protein Pst134EA_002953 [Puccinia striiformis f. sp. tritici]
MDDHKRAYYKKKLKALYNREDAEEAAEIKRLEKEKAKAKEKERVIAEAKEKATVEAEKKKEKEKKGKAKQKEIEIEIEDAIDNINNANVEEDHDQRKHLTTLYFSLLL